MTEFGNEKFIKDYLLSLGIPKYNQGFYYITCFLKTYSKQDNPIVNLRDVYESLENANLVDCSYQIFYHGCLYAIKASKNPIISNKSVKEFFYDAYESIQEGKKQELSKK